MAELTVVPLDAARKADRAAFVDLGREFAARVPHAVPQLRSELLELVDPAKNPFFEHADVQLFIAKRGDEPVGRISAHIDHLALEMKREQGFGPGTGNFGYFDAADEQVAKALMDAAEGWLRAQGMVRSLGPISMSVWEEPGLLVQGHDHSPMMLMGHHPAHYRAWIEGNGYTPAKKLLTYDLDVVEGFPPLVQRIVKSGERNERIVLRPVNHADYANDVRIVLEILNDAWSGNWGFVPFTQTEIRYASKKLKPLFRPETAKIIEFDGRPVAFMIALPDMNEVLARIGGKLLPFGWISVLRWIRNPQARGARVPLMGVRREFHNSRLASQFAFMMISAIRDEASVAYGFERAEIGWILEDNQGMVAIADAIESKVNREYLIYEKAL